MRSVIRIRNIAFATLLLCLFVFASQSVQAATLIVSTTADGGNGSLRQAIIDATSNAAANTINFNIPLTDSGYNSTTDRFTITLVNGLPDLPLAPLTIDNTTGRGVTVRGNNTFRIFTLVNSAVVNLNHLTVSHGGVSGGLGGGIYMGDSAVLFLRNCILSDNTATDGGGGVWVNDSGTLHVIDSTVRGNTSANVGGGIYVNNSGTLNISSSTVSGNTATNGSGGGIYNGVSGTVNATNSTVSGNTSGGFGGGIYNVATATVSSSTFTGNTATTGGGGIYNNFTVTLNNSLVALNTGAAGRDLLGNGSQGKPFTGNSNLVGDADGSTGFGPTTNQLGSGGSPINPRLGSLQDNGGPTLTHALLACSPAIDAGVTALAFDQRGETRPRDGDGVGGAQADIGSFELQAPFATICINGAPSAGQIIISEYRLRGPVGTQDEFIELYNTTNDPINVTSLDGSGGWAVATSDGVVRGVVPAGVTIPARGHFLLGCNCSYFTPDALLTSDVPDNSSLALFTTTNAANFSAASLLDAVGFTGAPSPYFEGVTLSPVGTSPAEHSILRRLTTGLPQDTGNNATDFVFITTDGGIYGGLQSVLGAPGPENLQSHIQRNATVKNMLLDPQVNSLLPPNRVRNGVPVTHGGFGTLSFRRRIRNMTGAPITQLRFRIVDITTKGSPGEGSGQADLRAVDSADVVVTTSNGVVTVRGTLVGLPPSQPIGGGMNSTLVVTLPGGGLDPDAVLDLQLVLGVEQGGSFRFFVNTEAVNSTEPGLSSQKVRSMKSTGIRKGK